MDMDDDSGEENVLAGILGGEDGAQRQTPSVDGEEEEEFVPLPQPLSEDDDVFEDEYDDTASMCSLHDDDGDVRHAKRRAPDWRVYASVPAGENHDSHLRAALDQLSEGGSGLTPGQSYQQKTGEECTVQYYKCSFCHRVKCPYKCRVVTKANGTLSEVEVSPTES